jgi:predicted RNase H-like nuclease
MIAAVDGCRAGWLVARAAAWPPSPVCTLQVCETFQDVLVVTADCAAVVVDIPIGLFGETSPCERDSGSAGAPAEQRTWGKAGPRECDRLARQRLGAAASRAFNPLPRPLLCCTNYTECNRLHRERYGRGISRQSFAIRAKLLDVDRLMTPALQERVREFHPELVWQRLNGGQPLPSKRRNEGLGRRIGLLRAAIPNLETLIQHPPPGAKPDDVLDALVGLELACRIAQNRAERLPECPCRDTRGLRMEIWF